MALLDLILTDGEDALEDQEAGGKSGCKKFELLMLSEIKAKWSLTQKDTMKLERCKTSKRK